MAIKTRVQHPVVTDEVEGIKAYYNTRKGRYEFFTQDHCYISSNRRIKTAKSVDRMFKSMCSIKYRGS